MCIDDGHDPVLGHHGLLFSVDDIVETLPQLGQINLPERIIGDSPGKVHTQSVA